MQFRHVGKAGVQVSGAAALQQLSTQQGTHPQAILTNKPCVFNFQQNK
jgi:hypothetical protein